MTIKFKGVVQHGTPLFTRRIELNLIEWLKWCLLECGAFDILNTTTPLIGGASPLKLYPVNDPVYASGRVWEGRRSSWVWESGLTYTPAPVPVTQVTVNGVPAVSNTYKVCYQTGRVLFNSAIALTSDVRCAHTARFVKVYGSDSPWLKELDMNSLAPSDPRIPPPSPSGDLGVLSQNRAQLPAYLVQPAGGWRANPYEIGASTNEAWEDFAIACLAETPWDRTWLHDALVEQQGTVVQQFDPALVGSPYDLDGALVGSPLTYPQMLSGFPTQSATIERATSGDFGRDGGLFWATVRLTLRVGILS